MQTLQKNFFYIVTPSFNAAATIERTIYSIINQKNIPFIRYHIQDGNSTDGTQDIILKIENIIKENQSAYSHIQFSWSSEKDSNMYDAIVKGFSKMNIPDMSFMGWLNADDILFPNALQKIIKISSDCPEIQWLGGIHCIIDEEDNILTKRSDYYFYPQQIIENGCCDGIHWSYIQQEGSFWRKHLWDSVQGLNKTLRFAGDWDLWRRMAQHSSFMYCPIMTGAFRKRPGQLSAQPGYAEEISQLLHIKQRKKYFMKFLFSNSSINYLQVYNTNGRWCIKNKIYSLHLTRKIRLYLISHGYIKLLNFLCHVYSIVKKS